MINVQSGVTKEHIGQLFEVVANKKLSDQYLNLQVLSVVHWVDNLMEDIIPFILINLGDETISLRKGEVVGSLEPLQIDVSEVPTDTAHEVIDPNEGYQTVDEESLSQKVEKPGASFITSPTDIEGHRKALLKDFPITSEETAAFKALCKEYKDVFSSDSPNHNGYRHRN